MDRSEVISAAEALAKEKLGDDATGHDWWHVDRVRKIALGIGEKEGGDLFVIELAALLHDISDHKFNGGDYSKGATLAKKFLRDLDVNERMAAHVANIIERLSFSANKGPMETVEGKIVQDADRLDAIGAIGIARCFATGCKFGQPIFVPSEPNGKHSIGHFYEKLLLLKDRMNTETGKELAKDRHEFMEEYLRQFFSECQ